MHDVPSHQCGSCGYSILNPAHTTSCPECGSDSTQFYTIGQLPLSGYTYTALWLYKVALLFLGLTTLAALVRVEPNVIGLQTPVRLTYYGWWIAAVPAAGAIVLAWFGDPSKPRILRRLWLAAGLFGWFATSVGLWLHGGSKELVAIGLVLSGSAPLGVLVLHSVLLLASRQMRRSVYGGFIISTQTISAIGMAGYVGIITLLYFDFSVGLDLYLGSRNFIWVELFFGGGLFLFLVGTIVALVLTMKLVLEHHERKDATASPSY